MCAYTYWDKMIDICIDLGYVGIIMRFYHAHTHAHIYACIGNSNIYLLRKARSGFEAIVLYVVNITSNEPTARFKCVRKS